MRNVAEANEPHGCTASRRLNLRPDAQRWSSAMIAKALSALMIVRNLEKIADHGKSIAGNVLFWMEGTEIHTPEDRKCSAR